MQGTQSDVAAKVVPDRFVMEIVPANVIVKGQLAEE